MAPIKQFTKENKLVSVIAGIILSALLTWGIWVTNGIFNKSTEIQIDRKAIETVLQSTNKTIQIACNDIDELKKEDKELRKLIYESNEKILNILLSIQRKIQ